MSKPTDNPVRGEFWRFGERELILAVRMVALVVICEYGIFAMIGLLWVDGPQSLWEFIGPPLLGVAAGCAFHALTRDYGVAPPEGSP